MVWETVAVETPASFATSLIVTFTIYPPCAMVYPIAQTISYPSIEQVFPPVKPLFFSVPPKIVKYASFRLVLLRPGRENVICFDGCKTRNNVIIYWC